MHVSLMYFAGCPNWRHAEEQLRQALNELGHPDTAIIRVDVQTEEQATAVGFRGSPTILVDGEDLFPDHPGPGGLSCRVYRRADGLAGTPGTAELVRALRAREGG